MKTKKQSDYAGGNVALLEPTTSDLERVIRLAEAGEYPQALKILDKPTTDPALRNALGVCNLRMGRPQEAVRIYRDLVLVPGKGWNKPYTPVLYKTNFALALLMSGHPLGAKEMLEDAGDKQHPSVARGWQTLAAWERTLSLWQWLNWKLFLLEPLNRPVTLDFEPGEFVDLQESGKN